jgi:DnaJ-class molecular chaperone
MKDLYKILGVAENADEATMKKAYRKLARENHPDATGGDKKKTERFKEIGEAYDVLSDKEKRAAYNRLKNAPVRPDGMPEGFDPEIFARTFGGGRGGGGGVHVGRGGFGDGAGGVDISDIFASLFGDASGRGGGAADWGGRARPRQNRGNDIAGTMEVTFSEAALGTRRRVQTGTGTNVEVTIPAGVESGGRLRVAGQGAPAPGKGGSPGDLYLDIQVLPDKHFVRAGNDVELAVPVSVSEAALGAKVSVPTVEGPVTVTIPPGSSSGAKLRLRGRGIKKADGTRGDQICRVEIAVPKGVPDDDELRKLFEEIGKKTQSKVVREF